MINAIDDEEVLLPDPLGVENRDINEILRGEISAKEAYFQVLGKVEDDPEAYRLKLFMLDHENATQFWKKQAKQGGKIPATESSVWGKVVEAFVGSSKIMGEEVAIKTLILGEAHGLSSYEKMLDSDLLNTSQKREIEETFIPRQKRHIESLEAMIEG